MIELGYDSDPDEFGIHDGRELTVGTVDRLRSGVDKAERQPAERHLVGFVDEALLNVPGLEPHGRQHFGQTRRERHAPRSINDTANARHERSG